MTSYPPVTVITPTWQRHDWLLNRCVPSVQAQTYRNTEHVVVSDGPDPELADKLSEVAQAARHPVEFIELPEHDLVPHWGHHARLAGTRVARELVTYCDDDDELRPNHCELLVRALLDNSEAGWARSLMASHHPAGDGQPGPVTVIGYGEPSLGNIGTPMIMHRRSILEHGTWGPASSFEDWELVNRWIHVGIPFARVEEITVDVWPSLYFG